MSSGAHRTIEEASWHACGRQLNFTSNPRTFSIDTCRSPGTKETINGLRCITTRVNLKQYSGHPESCAQGEISTRRSSQLGEAPTNLDATSVKGSELGERCRGQIYTPLATARTQVDNGCINCSSIDLSRTSVGSLRKKTITNSRR